MNEQPKHIIKCRHVNTDVILMMNYIMDLLEYMVNLPATNPKYKTLIYELYCEDDKEHDIEIQFDSIKNFNNNRLQLLSGKILYMLEEFDYNCDLVVQLIKMEKDVFGLMGKCEPLLNISGEILRTPNTFKRNKAMLKNTLMHELTHYVQYMSSYIKRIAKGDFGQKLPDYDKTFEEEVNKQKSQRYGLLSLFIYAFTKNELNARVAGIYGTITEEFDKLIKLYKKQYKKFPSQEEFKDFVIYNERYNQNELHTLIFNDFIDALENDSYEDYKKCIDDTNIYRDDSWLYCLLNLTDHLSIKPMYILPYHSLSISNVRTEQEFNDTETKIIIKLKRNMKKYIHNVGVVVADIYDDMI